MEALQPYLQNVLTALVSLAAAALAYFIKVGIDYLKVYIANYVASSQLELMKQMASSVVRELAQNPALQNLDNAEKKERAIMYLDEILNKKFNLGLDNRFLATLVEEAVNVMKTELKK